MKDGGPLEQCLESGCSEGTDVFSDVDSEWGKTDATQTTALRQAPKVLLMSLGRFKWNNATARTEKLNYRVEFPQQVDMWSYCETAVAARIAGAGAAANPGSMLYDLVGVVTHMGTTTAGHYFSFAKHHGKWHKLNDEAVSAVTQAELERECFGDGKKNTNAFLLVYQHGSMAGGQAEQQQDAPEPEPESSPPARRESATAFCCRCLSLRFHGAGSLAFSAGRALTKRCPLQRLLGMRSRRE